MKTHILETRPSHTTLQHPDKRAPSDLSHLALQGPKGGLGHQTKFHQLQPQFLTISGLGLLSLTWALNLFPLPRGPFWGPRWNQLPQNSRRAPKDFLFLICLKLR